MAGMSAYLTVIIRCIEEVAIRDCPQCRENIPEYLFHQHQTMTFEQKLLEYFNDAWGLFRQSPDWVTFVCDLEHKCFQTLLERELGFDVLELLLSTDPPEQSSHISSTNDEGMLVYNTQTTKRCFFLKI